MKPRPFVSGLLLAAGLSSRFGSVKQVAELEGVSLVERALDALTGSDVEEVIVVLGNEARRVGARVKRGDVKVVFNADFGSGLSSSLKLGVRSLDEGSQAVVVCLADQPFVTSELLDRIIEVFRVSGADAVSAASGDLISPPVLISRKLYREVEDLEGDKGAKSIVMRQPHLEKVEVDPGVLLDVDTQRQLQRAKELLGRRTKRPKVPAGSRPLRDRPSSSRSSLRRRGCSRRSGSGM